MPRPGPSLNSALWGFEVDSCCGSSEGPPALQRGSSAGEDKAFSPYSALGPAAPAHPAPSSGQAPAQPRLPLLRARARCVAQLWGHKPPGHPAKEGGLEAGFSPRGSSAPRWLWLQCCGHPVTGCSTTEQPPIHVPTSGLSLLSHGARKAGRGEGRVRQRADTLRQSSLQIP